MTTSEMKARCQHCCRKFRALPWKLGMLTSCPYCHKDTLLDDAYILDLGTSGWSVTFADFVRLASEPHYAHDVLPLLHTFGYTFVQERPLHFRNAFGKNLTAEEAHTQIQSNPSLQYRLYQAAMKLWWG